MNTYIISLHHFKYCTASLFIRVDAVNEAVYERFAEPVQEPPAGEQQIEEALSKLRKTLLTPLTCKASPGA